MAGDDSRSDEELVARANHGDADAFEALYRRHRDWVASLAWRLLRDRDEALDVLQETFAHLFGRFPGFQLTASLRTYLYPVVKHRCLDRLRRRRPGLDTDVLQEPLAYVPDSGPDTGLLRALLELPPVQREVVALRFLEDMSLDQIAQATETPLGTVKSRLHHALLALRAKLA